MAPNRGAFVIVALVLGCFLVLLDFTTTSPTNELKQQSVAVNTQGNFNALLTPTLPTIERPLRRRRKGKKKLRRNGTRRRKNRRRFNQSSAGLLTPLLESTVVSNTIIRTGEGDDPHKRLLIQTVRGNSSSGVRYYPSYLTQWQKPTSRYDQHYLNWRGLRFGCACDPSGSESAACDIVTGQCPCRENITGRACNRCIDDHWGLDFGKGCRACNCDLVGAQTTACDLTSGQCLCKPGVGGSRCDACLPGYFGFSEEGCLECEKCDHDGYVCHPKSGRCVCPPNTQGPKCQSCDPHSWGFRPSVGCSTCNCDTGGAMRGQCDFTTGQCECRAGYAGLQCDHCAGGHYGFPVCRPCQCDPAGSKSSECDASGLCECKPNVQGTKCDKCLPGTFALQSENPNGCTACFCFGRSASCTQAGLSWSQIRAARPRAVEIEYDPSPPFQNTLPFDTQEICYINLAVPGGGEVSLNGFDRGLNVTNNLRTIPGDTEDVKIGVSFLFDTPVYWQLPKQFLGDKVLSYGGFLKFRVESEGGATRLPPGVLVTYPLVQLQGNGKLVLEHYPILSSPNGHYHVRFHESLWMEKNPKRPASRETLMVALQNIQYILIRASDAVDFTRLVLKDVSMDTAAVPAGAAHVVADGVEVCECPPEYNSTSCQDPSIGFYRWFNRTYSTATILISLVGEARPCECNGRSSICDTETGYCKNCANYTGGDHCERCADGFYGDPATGPCHPCPCPSHMQNFASACRIFVGRDPVCFCREGYSGPRCDRCAYGWFGHPELPGGFCQPCECHPFGSVSDECHEQTGQCNCKRGILGLDCSICPNRTVLTAKGCSTCEDGCTGILLKDFDSMRRHLEFEAAHIRTKQDMPWWRLQELVEGPLTSAERLFDEWETAARNASQLIENGAARRLATAMRPLFEQAGELTELGETVSKTASLLKASSEKLSSEVSDIRSKMEAVVRGLFQYSGDGRVSDAAALMEARRLLEKITSRYFEPRKKQAELILDICHHAMNSARMVDAVYPIFNNLISRVDLLRNQLMDFHDLIQNTLIEAEKRAIQAGELRRKLRGTSEKVTRAKAGLSDIFEMHSDSNNYLDNAEDALMAMDNNYHNLTNVRGALKNSSLILERKEGILYGLNPLYRAKYVTPAQEHAQALARLAQDYQMLFNKTIADAGDALRASKAYEEVVGSMETAREAAEVASVSAEIALKQVFPSENEDSVIDQAQISKSVSSRFLARASTHQNGTSLQSSLRERQSDVALLENTVREVGNADNNIAREVQNLEDMKVGEKIDTSLTQMASVDAKMAETKEHVLKISEEVTNKLRPQLTLLANEFKEFDLMKARENIEESLKAHQRASDMVRKLSEEMELRKQRHSFRHTNETLSRAFINLRNKITEARHAAQGIRLSLRSTQGKECVRSFKVPRLEPTIANRIVITLSLAPADRNGLLFYLPSSTSSDFLAVELVNGRVRFVWDLGGGASVVAKPLNEDPKAVLPKVKWYKIIAERTSYIGKLWIVPGGISESSVTTASNSSIAEFSWLDVGPTDRMWVGGLPSDQEPSHLLQSAESVSGLIGCLHSITLDDTPIGLWNFYKDHTGGCSACIQGAEEVTDESTYRFNGEGYSVLRHAIKSTVNKYQFAVSLRFKTYDDNAVLFVAISLHKERYITLLLREGRVVFQIGYGGDSQLEMSSSRQYNNGKWTLIEASRSFDRRRGIEKGLLKVGDETKEAAPPSPPTQMEIPDLTNAEYLVGGSPQGYNFGQLHLRLPKSFLGCMSDLFVDRELYTPLRGRSNGISPGCVDQVVKVAGFHGDGYLQLEATPLKKKSAFGLVLRTLQADAIVLLATDKEAGSGDAEDDSMNAIEQDTTTSSTKRESYYSVALVDGRVEVRVEAGRGAITLVSQAVVNDGRFHAVLVTKTNRRLDLRVDDELQATSTLPEGANSVKVRDLYLGGAPKNLDVGRYVSDVTPFTGTLKDLLFNYRIISIEPVNSAPNVELGRPGPEKEDAALLPSLRRPWSPSPGCRRARKYVVDPRAVKFGDAPNSHVQIALRRRGPPTKNFTLELDFRTFYPDGLLFLFPSVQKAGGVTKQFLLGTLRNGQLHVIAKTKNRVEILSGTELNDGIWHKVNIVRDDRKLSVAVDSLEPAVAKLPKKINTGIVLYIGGLPEGGLLLPRNLMARLEGFRGCVRNLAINNQSEGLIGDKVQHERVGQCFPQVEPGSYFSGDAYIVHRKNFRIEDLLRLKFDFRTSELAGVLLSISDPLGYPAFALEFSPGKVIFSGDIGDRRMFRLVVELESQFAVCDNRWHHVSIAYEAEEVVMAVDQSVSKVPLLRNNHFLYAYLDAPLYIGGLPEHTANGKPLLETRDNFKGCLRNLMIAGESKDWTDMYSLHNVLVGSCPAVTLH